MHLEQVLVPLLGPPQKNKLHHCHPDAEGRGQSHAFSLAVCPESMNFHRPGSTVSVGSPHGLHTHTHPTHKEGLFPVSLRQALLLSW